MSNLLGKMTTGGRMSSNWTEAAMNVVIEARIFSDMSNASKQYEVNGHRKRPANLAMPKDLEMTDMPNE